MSSRMAGSLIAGSDIRGCLRRVTMAPGPRSVPYLTGFEAVDWRAWSDEAGRRAHLDPISVLALNGIP